MIIYLVELVKEVQGLIGQCQDWLLGEDEWLLFFPLDILNC